MNETKFKMFDAVRVITPPTIFDPIAREPRAGDVGVVVMIYDSPVEGYGVEGVEEGRALWLADFKPSELDRAKEA